MITKVIMYRQYSHAEPDDNVQPVDQRFLGWCSVVGKFFHGAVSNERARLFESTSMIMIPLRVN